ncbi:GMC oxidoreductase [Dothidotthia symphoricarpi CBS 119687]|uniref:GMC oxidoreductase n=1 Tax=Dothidotthia symphoricarpi CBS 119687 TaxID=1392245 RepID=A0A6A6AHB0_9PLEO|nr:GMC oxidoreductase [Dothidotthia symphoricarpi CBS 119687]KAF2130294.1 GMC oxidoreductase [Dothidotthia symphoricarpi CBS 119687]
MNACLLNTHQLSNSRLLQIIVGGGTAGLALATRLSQELPDDCVLVVEAGPDGRNEPGIYVPGLRGTTFGTAYDWSLPTTAQTEANNRTIVHNRGRVLGGSSALNLLVWDRASMREYDAWEELGNPGWNWKSMYPAMLKAENFQRTNGTAQYGDNGVGYGGPIQTSLIEDPPLHLQAGIPTLQNLGLEHNLTPLNGHVLGAAYHPATNYLGNHTRSYSVAFLPRAGNNLVIMFNTTVHKVDLNSNASRATGVVLTDGRKLTAKKEVILSAGSLLSPKILELSGIGQKAVLANAGIRQKLNLPGVGENLQDHLRIQNTYELRPNITGLDILKYNKTRAALELALWKQGEKSLYQYAGSCFGFLKWHQTGPNASRLLQLARSSANTSNIVDRMKLSTLLDAASPAPDLEVVFSDGYLGTRGYPAANTTGYGKKYASLIAGVMHPFARGTVHISSPDPLAKPTINPRYLAPAFDLEATAHAAQYLRTIASTPPFRDLWVSEFDPGAATETHADWVRYVRENVFTFYHPMGSCAMLPRGEGGVVDPQLRVYGVGGLRVVDASVIPVILSAHVQTAMIARRYRGGGA